MNRKLSVLIVSTTLILFSGSALLGQESVKLSRSGGTISVEIGGRPFTAYHFGPQSPKPYISPLRSAQGTIVTRQWPMVKGIPGEDHDHPHHRGMFFAHGNINGVDFWGEKDLSRKAQTARGVFYSSEELPKGETRFRKLDELRSGPHFGTVRAEFDLVGPDGKIMGAETQSYTFSGGKNDRIIDCAFTIHANHGALKMEDTKEGTFAVRVVRALDSPPSTMVNSNGAVGEKNIWGKKADWVNYDGTVKGEPVGIAIFDNPANLRHPTTWHARGYGLFAANPFGLKEFENNPKADGSYTIPDGGRLTLRYRVLIHHGNYKQAHVAEAYKQYAAAK